MHPWMKYFRCAKVKLKHAAVSHTPMKTRQDIPVVDETPDEAAERQPSPEATHGVTNDVGVGVLTTE